MPQQQQHQQQPSPPFGAQVDTSHILHESMSWEDIPLPPSAAASFHNNSSSRRVGQSSSFNPQFSQNSNNHTFGRHSKSATKEVWLYRAVVVLYGLFGLALVSIARGILLPHNLRQVWEQAETMELLLSQARTHQLELASQLEASRQLSTQYQSVLETMLTQEDVWRRQQDDMEDYFQDLMQQLRVSEQQWQEQWTRHQQQQHHHHRWRRMVQSVSGAMGRTVQSLGQVWYDYGPSSSSQQVPPSPNNSKNHDDSAGDETTKTQVPARQQPNWSERIEQISQLLDRWLDTIQAHVSAASVYSISPKGIYRNESMGTRFMNSLHDMMSSRTASPPPTLPETAANTTSMPSFSSSSSSESQKSPKRFGWKRKDKAAPPARSKPIHMEVKRNVPVDSTSPIQRPATVMSTPSPAPLRVGHQDSSNVPPFQVGDHVAQKMGRWKQRHGIVVDVHRLPDRKTPSSVVATKKYLVTIASPSKSWTGGRCTRKTGLLKKHEIVAKSPPRSGNYPAKTFVIQYPNEVPRHDDHLHETSITSISVSGRDSNRPELVLQRAKFLLEAPSGRNRALFWDLQLLLKQSSWMASWCKTGSWHGMPLTKKKRRRMIAVGTGVSAAVWAVVAPTSALFLSLGAVAAGPLALVYIPRAAMGMWKESNGKYLDGVFQKWIKAQVRAAKAAAAAKIK